MRQLTSRGEHVGEFDWPHGVARRNEFFDRPPAEPDPHCKLGRIGILSGRYEVV